MSFYGGWRFFNSMVRSPRLPLYVKTRDSRFFLTMTKILDEERIPWTILESTEMIPGFPCVIINCVNDEPFSPAEPVVLLTLSSDLSTEILLFEVERHRLSKATFERMVIAIDPGTQVFGIAVLLDATIIITFKALSIPALVDLLAILLMKVSPMTQNIVLKVGDGVRTLTHSTLDCVFTNSLEQYPIEVQVVNEGGSNREYVPNTRRRLTAHEIAAINIAFREGQSVTSTNYRKLRPATVPRTAARNIQHLSRKATEGRISISQALAEAVYRGEISLAEAIEQAETKK
jgi:hypothetical protein